jgi:hypothetical protein
MSYVPPTDDQSSTSPFVSMGSSWAQSGGPFGPEGSGDDGRRKLVTIALLAAALVLSGIMVFALVGTSSDEESDTPIDAVGAADTSPTVAAPEPSGTSPSPQPPETTAPAPPDDPSAVRVGELFTGNAIATLIDEVAVANGTEPLQILSVLVYPEYLAAQVQGPAGDTGIVQYRWTGQVDPASPAQVAPGRDVAAALFDSDEVAWSDIPALVDAAAGAVSIDGGVVTHLIVERALPFSEDVRIRVFVSGPGGDGFVDADATATMISINGN